MMTATLWVRGPSDINWRINAVFHRHNMSAAIDRVCQESNWYHARGYRTFIGPDAPELPVPLRVGEEG